MSSSATLLQRPVLLTRKQDCTPLAQSPTSDLEPNNDRVYYQAEETFLTGLNTGASYEQCRGEIPFSPKTKFIFISLDGGHGRIKGSEACGTSLTHAATGGGGVPVPTPSFRSESVLSLFRSLLKLIN